MFPSKHHKDDKGKDKDHKKGPRKNSFSVVDKSGLAFVRKKTKDGQDYEVTVEKVKPKSRKSSHSHHDRDALPDIGRLRIEHDPDRYDARRHSRGGDSYGSYESYGSYGSHGSREYLVRNPQSPGRDSSRVSGSGSSRRYTNTQYPDPEDRDVFYSDEDEESEVPYQDQRGHRGSSSYQSSPHPPDSVYTTGSGSVGTNTLYERRRGDFGHGDRQRDRDGSRHGSVQDYDYDYDSDEDYPPHSRHSTSTRRSSQSHGQSSRYTGDSSRYTDDTSRYSHASGPGSHQQPPPPGSSKRHSSHRAPPSSSRHSQATAPDSPYRANPHAEITEAEDRVSLRSRDTSSAGTAYEVPAPGSGPRHRAPATGFRAPPSQSRTRREGAYNSERSTGPDPFRFQVPSGSYTSDGRSGTGTTTSRSSTSRGTGASSGYPATVQMFHYYEEGNESTATGSGTSSRGTVTRSRTGTSIPSDSDSDDTVTASRREGRRGSSHTGSGSRQHHRRDVRGGGGGSSWIGSSHDGFSTFG